MKNIERIDLEDIEEDTGSRRKNKITPRTLNPDTVSHEEVARAFSAPHIDSLNPEEILILREEGKLPESDSNLVADERLINEIKPQDSHNEVSEIKNLELAGEEMLKAVKDKDEIVPRERVTATHKEKDNFSLTKPHGHRGREHKGKHHKGSETIKGRMN